MGDLLENLEEFIMICTMSRRLEKQKTTVSSSCRTAVANKDEGNWNAATVKLGRSGRDWTRVNCYGLLSKDRINDLLPRNATKNIYIFRREAEKVSAENQTRRSVA